MDKEKKTSKPIVIIHFQPLELYPPVMNLIRYIEKHYQDKDVEVITSKRLDTNKPVFMSSGKNVRIRRFGEINQQQFPLWRLINYVIFYFCSFCTLVRSKPAKVLYYETMSSFPVYLYTKVFKKNISVFIHYHEYTTKEEYASGMRLVRLFHSTERLLYGMASWISHTNSERIRLFQQDEHLQPDQRFHVLPNYPPQSWLQTRPVYKTRPVKFIYIGALSLDTMYTRQFAEWVIMQHGDVTWDIYAGNTSPEATSFFSGLNSPFITLHAGVDYYSLPEILSQYHIGIILYNGHIPNYVYNAPNKLFEYIGCSLDVWVPGAMTGCSAYYTNNTYPKVIPVNFQEPGSLNYKRTLDRKGDQYKASTFYYEKEYEIISQKLFDRKYNADLTGQDENV